MTGPDKQVFFAPLNPFGNDPDEPHFDYTVLQKVHHETYWKRNQDAVYWIKISRAQDQGLRFWQTKSFAINTYTTVPRGLHWSSDFSERRSSKFRKLATDTQSLWKQRATWESLAGMRDDTKHATTGQQPGNWCYPLLKRLMASVKEELTDTNTKDIERIKIGSNKICIREDLAKENMMFSKESRQAIFQHG